MAGRVLMIDDSELALEIQVMMLERRGYEVRACVDLDDIRAAKDSFVPDLVLTDVGLGDITVEDACQTVRATFGDEVPILLFSGREHHELEALAAELDVDGYVGKGDSQQEVADKLEAVLRLSRIGVD